MTEALATRRRQLRLRRTVYEWGFLAFASMSILCLGYWVVSMANAKSDINLAFGEVDVSVARGSIIVRSDRYRTLQNLSAYAGTQFGSSGPIMVGQPHRSKPAYLWDRRDSLTEPVRRPPLAPR
jgi:hypothetical protein